MSQLHPVGLSPHDPVDLTGNDNHAVSSVKKRKSEQDPSCASLGDSRSPTKKKKVKLSHEVGEKRLRRFRHAPPKPWHDVYQRAMNQRFYVLQRERCGTEECPEERVEMTGSTGNIYTVYIGKLSSCNCPHALKGNECKHVIYVMSQVLRAPFDLSYQRALISSELCTIFASAPPIAGPAGSGAENQKRKELEGDCPICYSELDASSPESITWCQAMCGQNMHQQCLAVWVSQGKRTCPMCRSAWHEDAASLAKNINRNAVSRPEGYANIGAQLGLSLTRVIPPTMRSLVAPRKCRPSEYEVREVPTPRITSQTQVLLHIHAAAIMTGNTQMAAGQMNMLIPAEYPFPLGLEAAGVVVTVGSEVKSVKVGDEVYGACVEKPFVHPQFPGLASEYGVVEGKFLLQKPPHLSFEEAVSVLANVATAEQVIRRGLQLRGEESLEGKTVYIPAALSATGSMAIQVAKNVFGATRIISSVSTPKLQLVEECLPGMVDQVVDYQTQRVEDVIPKGSVDFALNTQFGTYDECIALLNPAAGTLVSIASVPSRATLAELIGGERMSWWLGLLIGAAQLWYRWKARGTGIKWEFVSGSLHIREDIERAGEIIARGKVKPVMKVVRLEDVEAVREGCEQILSGKGGTGRLIIKII
ncbi:NADPH-dependent alkenal/one oxidoreductase, chloroplastic [Paramyrothecium foliicola]|nr:NADPH-dependent alkenal/one oxidoreductase, chloroplastic [Paramyrothecium foliicola]